MFKLNLKIKQKYAKKISTKKNCFTVYTLLCAFPLSPLPFSSLNKIQFYF